MAYMKAAMCLYIVAVALYPWTVPKLKENLTAQCRFPVTAFDTAVGIGRKIF